MFILRTDWMERIGDHYWDIMLRAFLRLWETIDTNKKIKNKWKGEYLEKKLKWGEINLEI